MGGENNGADAYSFVFFFLLLLHLAPVVFLDIRNVSLRFEQQVGIEMGGYGRFAKMGYGLLYIRFTQLSKFMVDYTKVEVDAEAVAYKFFIFLLFFIRIRYSAN